MKKQLSFIKILFSLGLIFAVLLSSCSKESSTQGSLPVQAGDSGTHIVIDHGGNEVEVPNNIQRVVIDQIPILSTYMAYFEGAAPYLVGFAGSFKDIISKTVLSNIVPELMEANTTVYAQSDINVEEIVRLNPDVIFYNANNREHAQAMLSSGIPAVGFATINSDTPADPLLRYKMWLKLLEDVFGEPGKMDRFFESGDKIVEEVEGIIAGIPQEERPSAVILYRLASGVPQVAGRGVFGYYWLEHLGINNVAAEAQGFAQTSFEQLYIWNPDVLFLNGPGLLSLTSQDVLSNSIPGANFSPIKAVQEARVHNTTLGMWNWFTPNPDAPLVLAWLACKTYPEAFADYPLVDTIRGYYREHYGYEVTDEDLEEMLQL